MFRGHSTTPTLILSVVVAALGATVALFVPLASAQSESCNFVVAPNGSDQAAGTVAAPLRTVDELLDRLGQGQTGCLRSGTYVADQFKVSTAAVKLTSYPGERATMRGRLRFNAGADGAVAEGLMLDGRNPGNLLGPLIYADRVVLRNNEITNYNTAICVDISDYPGEREPRGVLIEGNRIHHCGTLPATNHQHGIYVAHARDTVIRNNLIYANADRGIQLYPDADDSLITGNVIEGNGQGVIFGGDDNSSSDRNIVEGNVIANSTIRYNVQSHWQGPTGSGNVARRNCVW
ncbi:MAG TPA: right-handed parallel beta-helix repeat-containing protein, partial [Polyangia bacterium]|nr:right-handed parallel beta-helix repeat-containing protein [Polyangia bacterium]